MTPEDAALDWLVNYLETDSELSGLVNGVAPNAIWGTLASPFVRVDYLDGDDLVAMGLHRIWGDLTYHVRGVFHWRGTEKPDRTEVNAIGARIDALLHDHEEQTATVAVHSFREEPEPIPSVVENGQLWLQSGGVYRVRAQVL
jgi:hypothetical protein